MEYAEQQFELGSESDPKSKISQLRSVERQLGRTPPELLNLKELPVEFYSMWKWFLQLNSKRQSGMSINSLSWSDIHSYFSLLKISPTEEELDILTRLDSIALSHYSKQQEQANKQAKAKK
jgi:hypothetical protein